jgi:hypothetical protein
MGRAAAAAAAAGWARACGRLCVSAASQTRPQHALLSPRAVLPPQPNRRRRRLFPHQRGSQDHAAGHRGVRAAQPKGQVPSSKAAGQRQVTGPACTPGCTPCSRRGSSSDGSSAHGSSSHGSGTLVHAQHTHHTLLSTHAHAGASTPASTPSRAQCTAWRSTTRSSASATSSARRTSSSERWLAGCVCVCCLQEAAGGPVQGAVAALVAPALSAPVSTRATGRQCARVTRVPRVVVCAPLL